MLLTKRQRSATTSWAANVYKSFCQLEKCFDDHVQSLNDISKDNNRTGASNHVTKYSAFILCSCRVRRHSQAATKASQQSEQQPILVKPPSACLWRAARQPTQWTESQEEYFTVIYPTDIIRRRGSLCLDSSNRHQAPSHLDRDTEKVLPSSAEQTRRAHHSFSCTARKHARRIDQANFEGDFE